MLHHLVIGVIFLVWGIADVLRVQLPGVLARRLKASSEYEVVSFDGDYVNLRRTDIESDELNPVALALLPPEIDVGSKLKCEYFQYEIIG